MVKLLKNNWCLLLILFLALFLRTIKIDYVELFGDELDAGYQSYSLLTTGRDYKGNFLPSYIHSFSEWRAPGLMYAMVPFIKVFGLNEAGVRIGPAIFGVISILALYLLLGINNFGIKVKLMTVFILAITPWHIQYSRAGFEVTLLSCLLLFGLYFLILGIRLQKKHLIVVASILLSLSLYTYSTANVLMPLMVLLTIGYYKIRPKQLVILVVVGLIVSSPFVYQFLFGHVGDRFATLSLLTNKDVIAEVNDYRNASNHSLLSAVFYNKFVLSAKKVVFNYSNALGSNFLFNEGDVTFRHSLHQVGNLFWVELPLILIGVYFLVIKKVSGRGFWIGLLLIAPVASSLTIDGYNHATRLFMMVYPLSFLAAYGFYKLGKLKWLVVIVLLFEFFRFQFYYWNFYRNQSWRWWHTGYKDSMLYIKENSDKYNFVLMDNTYEPSLIRFLFWNKIDSRYMFDFADNKDVDVGVFRGFCLQNKYCFVNFADKFRTENLVKGTLYMISQERNVGGDWYWSYDPPSGIKVLRTVSNYYGQPLFYLVTRE